MKEKLYIDDIIREEKKKYLSRGIKPNLSFLWGKLGYEQLRSFVAAVIPCPHGLNCLTCDYGERYVDKYFKKDFAFMGARHSWDRRKNQFLISVNNEPT